MRWKLVEKLRSSAEQSAPSLVQPFVGPSPNGCELKASRPQLLQSVVDEQAVPLAGHGCIGFRRAIGDEGVAASPKVRGRLVEG